MNQRTESHDTLPALPEPAMQENDPYSEIGPLEPGCPVLNWYSAEQMHAYAREATAQQAAEVHRLKEHAVILAATAEEVERERCAKLCEDQDTGDASNWSMAVQECARLIRARQDGAGEQP